MIRVASEVSPATEPPTTTQNPPENPPPMNTPGNHEKDTEQRITLRPNPDTPPEPPPAPVAQTPRFPSPPTRPFLNDPQPEPLIPASRPTAPAEKKPEQKKEERPAPLPQLAKWGKATWTWFWGAIAVTAALSFLFGHRLGPERIVGKPVPGETKYEDTPATKKLLEDARAELTKVQKDLKEVTDGEVKLKNAAELANIKLEAEKTRTKEEKERADGLKEKLDEANGILAEIAKWGDPVERPDLKASAPGKIVVEINDPDTQANPPGQ